MAKLTSKDVKHVASLANLELTSAETEKYKKQLSNVIGYVDELNEVDTSKVEPTHQTTGLQDVTRDDKPNSKSNLNQKESLSGTNNTHNGYFVTKAVLEKK